MSLKHKSSPQNDLVTHRAGKARGRGSSRGVRPWVGDIPTRACRVKDQWIEERVNVLQDYTRLFGEPPAAKSAGIAVLTDADDTRSRAEGDYAKFRVCR